MPKFLSLSRFLALFKREKPQPALPESFSRPKLGPFVLYDGTGATASKTDATISYGRNETAVDIVFIHGLGDSGGPSLWSWKDRNDNSPTPKEVHWLSDSDMLPAVVPNSRIIRYDWNARFDDQAADDILLGHANSLLMSLHNIRNPQDPKKQKTNDRAIIFVASCFGGLVLIKALQSAWPAESKYASILQQTAGVLFLSTPFQGTHDSLFDTCEVRVLIALHLGDEANPYLLSFLQRTNKELDEIVNTFSEMVEHDKFKFQIACFYERHRADYTNVLKRALKRVKGQEAELPRALTEKLKQARTNPLKVVVVDRHSACLQSKEKIALDLRHGEQKRFPSPTDPSFQLVAEKMRQFVNEAAVTLERREHYKWRLPGVKAQAIGTWLTNMDYSNQQADIFFNRQSGTGKQFMESSVFKRWLQNKPQTLFCSGIPGSGKTVLSSTIVNYLQNKHGSNPEIAVAYIYCDYKLKDSEFQSPDMFLRSLLKQLMLQRETAPPSISALYGSHTKEGRHTKPSLTELSTALAATISTYSRVFIVVDALDECSDDGKQLLQELLTVQVRCDVNLLVTSRFPSPAYYKGFKNSSECNIVANNADVRLYLSSNMQRFLPDFVMDNEQLKLDIISRIEGAAGGMFLLAKYYLMSFENKPTLNSIRRALGQIPAAPRQPFQGEELGFALDRIYSGLLERLISMDSEQQMLAKKALTWLTFAKRPLTPDELQHGLAVELAQTHLDSGDMVDMSQTITACKGLVTFQRNTNTIQLFHPTTAKFLESHITYIYSPNPAMGPWQTPSRSMIEKATSEAHKELARLCAKYLCYEELRAGPCIDSARLELRMKSYHLLKYAADYWGHHARQGCMQKNESSSILQLLHHPANIAAAREAMFQGELPVWRLYLQDVTGVPDSRVFGTGIHLASIFGLAKHVKYLLSQGCDAETTCFDNSGGGHCTPIELASSRGYTDVVEVLLQHQESGIVRAKDKIQKYWDNVDKNVNPALRRAVEERQERAAQILLQRDLRPPFLGSHRPEDLALDLDILTSARCQQINNETKMFEILVGFCRGEELEPRWAAEVDKRVKEMRYINTEDADFLAALKLAEPPSGQPSR